MENKVFNQNDDKKKKLFLKMLRSSVEFLGGAPSTEDMDESSKNIFVYPDETGFLETRRNEIGTFTLPAGDVFFQGKSENASLELNLPKIPVRLLHQTVSLFDQFMAKTEMSHSTLEAFVQIFWNRETKEYFIHVPEQIVSVVSVNYINTQEIMDSHLFVMDIHSHNGMSAFFSGIDDRDEQSTRLFGVVGRMNDEWPQASFRMGVGGNYHYLDILDVFDLTGTKLVSSGGTDGKNLLEGISREEEVPEEWMGNIKLHDSVIQEKFRQAKKEQERNKTTTIVLRDREDSRRERPMFFGGGEQLDLPLLEDPNVEAIITACADLLYEDPYSIVEALLDAAGNDVNVAEALVEHIGANNPGVIEEWVEDE